MSLSEHRRAMVRGIIYLVALALVLFLFLHRYTLLPPYGLRIIHVRETGQLGSIVAGKREKLLAGKVRLVVSADIREQLRSGFLPLWTPMVKNIGRIPTHHCFLIPFPRIRTRA